jgi:Flp pilus assembly pilin Flp
MTHAQASFAQYSESAKTDPVRSLKNGDKANNGQKKNEEDTGMDKITELFVKVREYHRGQTMTEYALILSAVAVVVFVGYQTMGTTIMGLITVVDGKL